MARPPAQCKRSDTLIARQPTRGCVGGTHCVQPASSSTVPPRNRRAPMEFPEQSLLVPLWGHPTPSRLAHLDLLPEQSVPTLRMHLRSPTAFHTCVLPHGSLSGCVCRVLPGGPHSHRRLSGVVMTYTSSRNAKSTSPSTILALTASNAACCPREMSKGTRASPCSPPSPCAILWTTPSLSSHRYRECDPPGTRTRASNMALREMESYAPTPSMESTVERGFDSVRT